MKKKFLAAGWQQANVLDECGSSGLGNSNLLTQ